MKRLLVSCFEPDRTPADVADLLDGFNFEFVVARIETRNAERYASFVIEVEEKNLETIMHPEIWPDGIDISEFFGRPRRLIGALIPTVPWSPRFPNGHRQKRIRNYDRFPVLF